MRNYGIVLLCAVVMLSACGEESPKKGPLHSVMTATPLCAGGETERNLSGVVRENSETSLGFKTGGQIAEIHVREGDRVKKGQLLAVLDDEDYRLGMEATRLQYEQMKDEVARMKTLFEGKSISANDYEKALSGLNQLDVQLQLNRNKLDYTRLYAPADAIVKDVNFEYREMVDAGTAVFTMLDVNTLEVEASIPYDLYRKRDRFSDIHCLSGDGRYPMRVKSVVPKADNSQLFTAKFSVEGSLTAGQAVDIVIKIPGETGDGVYAVPPHAVFHDSGKAYVWVVGSDSCVTRREVAVVGTDDNGNVLVPSGLDGRETIVRAGTDALTEKEKVKIIGEDSESNVGGLL